MIYSYYDEVIPQNSSLNFYEKLKNINPEIPLFTNYNSSHQNCMKKYCEPVYKYLANYK